MNVKSSPEFAGATERPWATSAKNNAGGPYNYGVCGDHGTLILSNLTKELADRIVAAVNSYDPNKDAKPVAWTTVLERNPQPHAKYLIRRNGSFHTATPCYGMHAPWWVIAAVNGGELEPVPMQDADEWLPVDAALPPPSSNNAAAFTAMQEALTHCLGLLCESGNLNNYRNLSDAELGKAWTETAKEAAAALSLAGKVQS